MGLETMALISLGSTVASGFMQYSQQKKADKAAKKGYDASVQAAYQQAYQDSLDADRAAKEELAQSQKAEKIQKMLFLKSGVDLTGSPLLVMEETRNKGNENSKNIRDGQVNRSNAYIESTKANRPVSRASLTSTIAGIGANAANTYNDYSLLKKQLA